MIENAGRSVAQLAMKVVKGTKAKIVILAGVGGTGAVGVAAARHLFNHNFNVSVCRSRAYQLSEQMSSQWKLYKESGGKEAQVGSLSVEAVGLIVDSLLGCGGEGPLREGTSTLVEWANSNGAPIVSVEGPSGIDPSTGRTERVKVQASITLELGLPKSGLSTDLTGSLYLADLGIPSTLIQRIVPEYTSPFGEQFIAQLSQKE